MRERTVLEDILAPGGLTPLFQPVFSLKGATRNLHYLECLTRGPKNSNMESANVLFEYVRLKREESLVDRACLTAALNHASALPEEMCLSLNVHASTLGRDHGFLPFLSELVESRGISFQRITIEIVEHAPPWDGTTFMAGLHQLRELGMKIALDDVGLGQSNYKMILDVHPDYLKIDRYFIHGCADDPNRQAVIESIQHLASRFGSEIVAEGIEHEEDLDAVRRMGIHLVQGYYFSQALTLDELCRDNPSRRHA